MLVDPVATSTASLVVSGLSVPPAASIIAVVGALVSLRIAYLDAHLRSVFGSTATRPANIAQHALVAGPLYFLIIFFGARWIAGVFSARPQTVEATAALAAFVAVWFANTAGVPALLAPWTSRKATRGTQLAGTETVLPAVYKAIEETLERIRAAVDDTGMTVTANAGEIPIGPAKADLELLGNLREEHRGFLSGYAAMMASANRTKLNDAETIEAESAAAKYRAKVTLASEIAKLTDLVAQLQSERDQRKRARGLAALRDEVEETKLLTQHATAQHKLQTERTRLGAAASDKSASRFERVEQALADRAERLPPGVLRADLARLRDGIAKLDVRKQIEEALGEELLSDPQIQRLLKNGRF